LSSIFRFKHFVINQENASLKVGTDAMILGAFCLNRTAKMALDVGTGTGVLSLMVAQTHPELIIDALDIDYQNCTLAKHNVANSQFSERINVVCQDIFDFNPIKKYDLIFSNPPFHVDSLKSKENRISKSKHFTEIEFASFIQKLSTLLSEKGKFFMIFPAENLSIVKIHLENHNFFINEIINIYGKPNLKKRVITVCSKIPTELKEIDFLIRDSSEGYSKEYIEKTKHFHGTDLG
jgi:tRNA1Val (adenine37-N6)-methyltransferase